MSYVIYITYCWRMQSNINCSDNITILTPYKPLLMNITSSSRCHASRDRWMARIQIMKTPFLTRQSAYDCWKNMVIISYFICYITHEIIVYMHMYSKYGDESRETRKKKEVHLMSQSM
jgi:hypothetical protein